MHNFYVQLNFVVNLRTILLCFGRCGHTEVAKALVLELQADITVRDNAGSTPLHIAAKNGHADIVMFLLTQPGNDPVSNLDFYLCIFVSCIHTYSMPEL